MILPLIPHKVIFLIQEVVDMTLVLIPQVIFFVQEVVGLQHGTHANSTQNTFLTRSRRLTT